MATMQATLKTMLKTSQSHPPPNVALPSALRMREPNPRLVSPAFVWGLGEAFEDEFPSCSGNSIELEDASFFRRRALNMSSVRGVKRRVHGQYSRRVRWRSIYYHSLLLLREFGPKLKMACNNELTLGPTSRFATSVISRHEAKLR